MKSRRKQRIAAAFTKQGRKRRMKRREAEEYKRTQALVADAVLRLSPSPLEDWYAHHT